MGASAQRVVVGVREGPESVAALRYGIESAMRRRIGVVVAHAYVAADVAPSVAADGAAPSSAGAANPSRVRARTAVDLVLGRVVVPPTLPLVTVIQAGPPLAVLGRLAPTAAEVVVGQHQLNLAERLTEGRLIGPLASHAACPVVIVPPYFRHREHRKEEQLVVPVDGLSAADAVLEYAFGEAERRQARVTVLHASPGSRDPGGGDTVRLLAEIAAGAVAAYPDVRYDIVVVRGEAGEQIVRASRNASLLVLGRPRPSPMRDWRVGAWRLGGWLRSVTRDVLKRTRCPLAVVPPVLAPPDATVLAPPETRYG